MAASLYASGSNCVNGAQQVNITVTGSPTPQAGDLVIAFLGQAGGAPPLITATPSIDWNPALLDSGGGGGLSVGWSIYWGYLTGTGSFTTTVDGDEALNALGGVIMVFSGVGPGSPTIDGSMSWASADGSSSQPDCPSATNSPTSGATPTCFTLALAASNANDASGISGPSGFVYVRTSAAAGFTGGAPLSVTASVDVTSVSPGASKNPGTWTGWNNGNPDWAAVTLLVPQITTSDATLTPTLLASDDAFFTYTVLNVNLLAPPLVSDADAFFSATVTNQGSLFPTLLSDADAFFGPTVQLTDQFLLPQLFVEDDEFIRPFVDLIVPLVPTVPTARTGSRTIILAEIDAVDADANVSPLRYGTDGVMTISEAGEARQHFEPRLSDPGNFERHMFEPSQAFGESTAGYGDVQVRAGASGRDGGTTDHVLDMGVDGRRISVYEVASKRTPRSQWQLRLRGVVDHLVSDDAYNQLGFAIRDVLAPFQVPLLTDTYGGTTVGGGLGTVDGDVPLTGVKKQRVYGLVSNVEAQVANPYDLVFQFSDKAVAGMTVRDAGAELINGGDFGTLAGLFAWVQVAGQYVTHNALGLARLGSSPVGAVTADVITSATAADMSAGQLVRDILDDAYQFITTTTTAELLSTSPDIFTTVNASIVGTTDPKKIVEAATGGSNAGHAAVTPTFSKEARSVNYTFQGEFEFPDSRGLVIIFQSTSPGANAGLVIPYQNPSLATAFEQGGYAVTAFEVVQIDGVSPDTTRWLVTFSASTNSDTNVSVSLNVAQTTVSGTTVTFDQTYSGNGTSGVRFQNLSLIAKVPISSALFDILDMKNDAPCGIVVTGEDTILASCNKLLTSIGGWLLPNQFGELEAGRLDYPAAIPNNTNEMIVGSPDSGWSTHNVTILAGGGASGSNRMRDTVSGVDFHYIEQSWMKEAKKIRYRFQGEFKAAGRNGVEISLITTLGGGGAASTGGVILANIATGVIVVRTSGADNGRSSTWEFVDITPSTGGFFLIVGELTSDDQTPLYLQIISTTDATFGGTLYAGDGTSGIDYRNLSLKPVDPTVAIISEEIILGESLQRQPTGDEGRGIPNWSVKVRYFPNWRVLQGTEVIPAVTDAERARLALDWKSTAPVTNTALRNLHPGSTELVIDTYLTQTSDADIEAHRRFELFGAVRSAYSCEVPDRYVFDVQLGDLVVLQSPRFGLSEGKTHVVIGRIENLLDRTTTLILWG